MALTRIKALAHRLFQKWLFMRLDDKVFTGPFAGTTYSSSSYHAIPCLLGTYEMELHEAAQEVAHTECDLVVDVGAASGIYVTGMGKLLPGVRMVAFEADNETRNCLRHNVATNSLDNRVDVHGHCGVDDLKGVLAGSKRSLVIMDVEGAEVELLQPARIRELQTATMIIETHENVEPGCSALIKGRFDSTHAIRTVVARARTATDFPLLAAWKSNRVVWKLAARAMSEFRSGVQEWLVLQPRK
jgi:hypothetical protein